MRVLLLAYETEGCSMAYLTEQLRSAGHEALVAHCDYYNFIDDNHIREFYRDRDFTDWVTYEEEYERLYTDDWDVDWDYLSEFESTYCDSKNVQQLVMSDPLLSREHHFRFPYMTPIESREQVFYWAELLTRWTMDLLEEFDPDVVLTYRRNYFIKNLVAQVSATTDLAMRTLVRGRIGEYCYLSDEFGLGTDSAVAQELADDTAWPDVSDGEEHVQTFRDESDSGGLYDANSQQRISGESLYTVPEIAWDFTRNIGKLGIKTLQRNKRKFRGGFFAENYFNSHVPSVVGFHARIAYNRLKYLYDNPFTSELPERPFVYVPLHTLPESSTLTLSTEYYETDLIRFMAKELPVELDIAVKENPNMVGTRPFRYYDDLKNHPRVHLIDPMVQSKRLIRESNGVCGISGTALLEAAMLDTPTHYFGCPEFAAVLDYGGHAEFGDFAEACTSGADARYPERVKRYIQYVINEGREVPITAVRTDPGSRAWREGTETIFEMLTEELDELQTADKVES